MQVRRDTAVRGRVRVDSPDPLALLDRLAEAHLRDDVAVDRFTAAIRRGMVDADPLAETGGRADANNRAVLDGEDWVPSRAAVTPIVSAPVHSRVLASALSESGGYVKPFTYRHSDHERLPLGIRKPPPGDRGEVVRGTYEEVICS